MNASARAYLRRGWVPVPVPLRAKSPTHAGWQNRTLETAACSLVMQAAAVDGVTLDPLAMVRALERFLLAEVFELLRAHRTGLEDQTLRRVCALIKCQPLGAA